MQSANIACRGVDPGGRGATAPDENIGGGGGKHRFAPNNFDKLKNS